MKRSTRIRILGMGFIGTLAGCSVGTPGGPAASTSEGPGDGTGETSDAESGTGEETETDGTGDDTTDTSAGTTGEEDGFRFDVAGMPDASEGCGGGGGNGVEFSYIWIANSNEGTVSKINTQTMIEEGRYKTRPDGAGNPSRTSVNLNGDVAVANRSGGVVMIYARPEDCPDPNNTSTGPNDVKPWPDGCVGWFTPGNYSTQRPVAWTQGMLDQQTCQHEDAKVWTAGGNAGLQNSVEVLLLDGATGEVDEVVPIPEVSLGDYSLGLYGAAVDGAGDVWFSQLNIGSLVRVRLDDLTYNVWPMATVGYGMTVDHLGRPWTCNEQVARFDPVEEEWTIGAGQPGPGGAGCMEDANGTMWVAGYAITAIDVETMELIQKYPMPVMNNNPDTGYGRGISIDFEGYVWSPSHWSDAAYRLDPQNGEFDKVEGLNFPYTYSDMTGFALLHAGQPEG